MRYLINTYLFDEYMEDEGIDAMEFCKRAKLPYKVYLKMLNKDYSFSVEYLFNLANLLEIKEYQLLIPRLKDLKRHIF